MDQKASAITGIVVKSVVSICCTLLLGLFFDGWNVFRYNNSAFEFVSYGILGSLYFFSLSVSVRGSFVFLILPLFLQCGLITKSVASVFFIRDIIFFAMVSVSIYVFFRFFHRPRRQDRRLEPLILATLMGFGFAIAVLLVHLTRGVVFSFEQLRFAVLTVLENGFLIGLGIGFGVFVCGTNRFGWIMKRIGA